MLVSPLFSIVFGFSLCLLIVFVVVLVTWWVYAHPPKLPESCDAVIEPGYICTFCGYIAPADAVKLLKTPGTTFECADWKYGGPHKYYLNGYKFYLRHLNQLSDAELSEFSELSVAALNIEFVRNVKGTRIMSPEPNCAYGYQLWGVIGPDGKPDHSRMAL